MKDITEFKFKKGLPAAFVAMKGNAREFCGGIVVYDKANGDFFRFTFGTGDNLTREDEAEGFNDYLNCDRFHLLEHGAESEAKKAFVDDLEVDIEGNGFDDILSTEDGGMMLIRYADYAEPDCGDIRAYLEDALKYVEFVGDFNDLEVVCVQ